jgi:RNA polymerase sigma-70 factor (ECF subfamily)
MTLVLEELQSDREQLIETVQAAQRGERQAFDALFERYHRAIFAVVLRRVNHEAEAQEVVQEIFIQAMRKIHQLQNPVCFGGWLRSIATRMAINRAVRSRSMLSADEETLQGRFVERETPLGQMLARERSEQLHLGLKRLNNLDRDTLMAFYFHGRSLIEMSDEFNSPVGTIKRRLHVARKRLAKELEALAPA